MLVCCFRTQLNVNGARTLLFGRARSAYCNKTQSMHVDDLFLLMEECLCAFSEWCDAQEAPSKKGTAASIDRHPEATPSRHPDNVDIHYGFALARVCRSCIRLQARASQHFLAFSSSSISASSQASPRARERVRVSTPSATTTSASSMSSQASPQARRDRVSNPSAATAPELVVAQGLTR